MLIVSVEKLREGMQLADDVYSTSATEYKLLYEKGRFLSYAMIEELRECGIKTVNLVGVFREEVAHAAEVSETFFADVAADNDISDRF